ncbi:Uncharacterised protein [Yersinia massiliensis]|nr:Uncharacterised protein [Yersinia massiliensis]
MVYVSFTDDTKTVIDSVFGSPQSLSDFPYQGKVKDDDPRYIAFIKSITYPLTE